MVEVVIQSFSDPIIQTIEPPQVPNHDILMILGPLLKRGGVNLPYDFLFLPYKVDPKPSYKTVISRVISYNPSKWPKIKGFHWGYNF